VSNKFVSFLQAVGKDFKKGLEYILPFAEAASVGISVVNPALGGLIQTSIATVIGVEQKFAAAQQQDGTGAQKLSDSLTILYPAFESIFKQYGVEIDKSHVENYINAIVAALNAFPPLPATALPAAPVKTMAAVAAAEPVTNG